VDNTEEQRIISFCTGYGGIEMGLERSGVNVRTVAACEIETYAIANLVDKMEKGALQPFPIWTNLKTFDGRAFHNKVHGIIGGYPCQPFSQAGKRKGVDDERHLWPYIQQHIDTIRPIWCFFENVAGHLNLGFDEVCKSLWDMGYRVEAGLFTASEVGAPHQRKRLFILAYSQYNGCATSKKLQSSDEASNGGEGGENGSCKSTGSNRSNSDSGVSRCTNELAYSDGIGASRGWDMQGSNSNTRGVPSAEGERNDLRSEAAGHCDTSRGRDAELEWPSRPTQPQNKWEQPRTLKPIVGGAANGAPEGLDANRNRVDRLRLLGNGVVPQTVELAWTTLWKQMTESETNNEHIKN